MWSSNEGRDSPSHGNHIPVSGPSAWPNLGIYAIPRLSGDVETPEIAVVMETVLVQGRELPTWRAGRDVTWSKTIFQLLRMGAKGTYRTETVFHPLQKWRLPHERIGVQDT